MKTLVYFCLLAVAAVCILPCPILAQSPPWYPGQSIVWQNARAPYTPGTGAIVGGPGASPNPGTPMYICRAMYQGSMTPGKWVGGSCNISYGGREYVMNSYQVAYGSAYWQPYQGNPSGLIQTGTEADGTPLYSCRVHYQGGFPPSDLGYQPGKIVGSNCDFPLGGQEIVQPPPFEALYSAGGSYPPYSPPPPPAPIAPPLGPSSVTWQSEQAPFTPGSGAIMGGPGDGPKPGSPLYICRAGSGGGLYPGKWIQGECSISYGGREYKMKTYDVAFGSATWGAFGGLTSNMIQGGYDSDQNPIFICRVPHFNFWFKDRGSQPGKLVGGQCLVSYGGSEIPSGPPFQALYSTASADSGAPPPAESAGVQVLFQSGTGSTPGKITIMNGATGKTATETLAANLDQAACVSILQKAALEAGLQIQGQASGLRIFGTNNSVNVSGASVSVTQF